MRALATVVALCVAAVAAAACRSPQQRAADRIAGYDAALRELDRISATDLAQAAPRLWAPPATGPARRDDDGPPRPVPPRAALPHVDWYWDDEEAVPLALVPNVVAVRGPRSLVWTGARFVPGVVGEVGSAHPAMAQMTSRGVYFVGVDPNVPADLDVHDAGAPGRLVGRVVLHPRPGTEPSTWPASVLTRRVAVRFRESVVAGLSEEEARAAVSALVQPLGLELADPEPVGETIWLFRAKSSDPADWLAAARAARRQPWCDGLAEPDFLRGVLAHSPTIQDQWHLRNAGQAGGLAGADVNVIGAWKSFTEGSADVVVAIVDKYAVDFTHPGLAGKAAPGSRDMTTHAFPAPPVDAHGTAVAGLAVADDPGGMRGVAPRCRFMNFVVYDATQKEIAKAFGLARVRGCRVANASFEIAPPGMDATLRLMLTAVATPSTNHRGLVVVASVSNEEQDNFVAGDGWARLAEHPQVIAVGSTTDLDLSARCGWGAGLALVAPSGRSAATSGGCALGVAQLATLDVTGSMGLNGFAGVGGPCTCPENADFDDPDYTRCFWGTSGAAPQVAGAAALLVSLRPALTPPQVRSLLQSTARKIAAGNPYLPDGAGGARSLRLGYGRLDVYRALKIAALTPPAP